MNDMMTPEEPHISDGWTFATLYKLCMQMFASVEIKAREIELRQQQRYEAQESIRASDRLYFDTKVQDLHELKAHDFLGTEKLIVITRTDFENKIQNIREIHTRDLQSIEQRFIQSKEAVADALAAAKEAVTKAEDATERRFACVSADTLILCADLIWRPAGNLQQGDELIGLDEDAPTRHGRRFRRSIVTENSLQQDILYEVQTTHGSVRCNGEHPWLAFPTKARRAGTNWRWVKTTDLQPDDQVMRSADVWVEDRSWEAGWLAGMYDGEGCLSFPKQTNKSVRNEEGSETSYLGCHLSVTQRESDTSTQLKNALECIVESLCIHRAEAGKHGHKQPIFHLIVVKRSDVMKILGSIRPPRLLIKSNGVWDGRPINGIHRETYVTSVKCVGEGTIAALATSTRTYIAGGFAMHNSVNEFRSTLSDQASQLMPRAEAQTRFETLQTNVARIELDLRGTVSTDHGKSSTSILYITTGIAVIAIIASLIVGFMPRSAISAVDGNSKRMDDLVARIDSMSHRLDGATQSPQK